jgi:hypothetical protein
VASLIHWRRPPIARHSSRLTLWQCTMEVTAGVNDS